MQLIPLFNLIYPTVNRLCYLNLALLTEPIIIICPHLIQIHRLTVHPMILNLLTYPRLILHRFSNLFLNLLPLHLRPNLSIILLPLRVASIFPAPNSGSGVLNSNLNSLHPPTGFVLKILRHPIIALVSLGTKNLCGHPSFINIRVLSKVHLSLLPTKYVIITHIYIHLTDYMRLPFPSL